MASIIDALKSETVNARLTCEDRWLVFVPTFQVWEVMQHKRGAKNTETIYSGPDEEAAVYYLVGGDL